MDFDLSRLNTIRLRETPPEADEYLELVDTAIKTMENVDPLLRPRDSSGNAGGLLWLTGGIPTVIIPDLHARRTFFYDILHYRYRGQTTILDALAEGSIRVVCVGDGFHSERHAMFRWLTAYEEVKSNLLDGPALTAEIAESMGLMEMVMECIVAFPNNFFFLKGNHENILNNNENGNHPFRKYADEGEMFYTFFMKRFGVDFTTQYALFEQTLPLFAVGERFIVSHAEPRRFYDEEDIIDARHRPQVIEELTWTENGGSEEGTVERMLSAFLPNVADSLYFGGHRPVADMYALRASDRYVQIHDPVSGTFALVPSDRPFDFEHDFRSV